MKILLGIALFCSIHTTASAMTAQDAQYLVDNVQTLAFNFAIKKATGPMCVQDAAIQPGLLSLLNEKKQGEDSFQTLQSISQWAHDFPKTELMGNVDIKKLMSAPEALLSFELSGVPLAAAKVLKQILARYQKGQPVKAQALNAVQKGNETYVQVRFFPEIVEQVEKINPAKVAALTARTDVVYVFNTKTQKLSQMLSETYSQALDLRDPQKMAMK